MSDDSAVEYDSGGVSDDDSDADAVDGGERGSREVEVPMALYKTVTVFSTLIAMVAVLLGFLFLDAATVQAGPILWVVDALADAVGVSYDPDGLSVYFGLLGLASIGVGAFVYAFSTRFRTPGMGKSKDDPDEGSGNG